MLPRRLLLLLSLVVTCAVAALAAGCGSSSSDSGDAGPVARAADVTAQAGGAHMTLTGKVAGFNLSGNGFLDLKQHRGKITLNLPGGIGQIQEVFLGTTFYVHLPAQLQSRIPGGKPWLKIDLGQAAKAQGLNLGALQSTSSSDPSQTLEQLRGAGQVKKVGTDTLRGVSTTHYSAVIDLNRAADRAPESQRKQAQQSVQRLIKLIGRSTIPVDVWLDDQGRLRRESLSLPLPQGKVQTTIDLYDFGTNETVDAPPADQTYDATRLVTRAQRQASSG